MAFNQSLASRSRVKFLGRNKSVTAEINLFSACCHFLFSSSPLSGDLSHSWKQLLPDFGGGRVVTEIPRLTANALHGRSGEMGEHDFTVKMHRWLQPALPSKQPSECCPSFWTAWRVRGRPQVNRIKKGVCFLFLGLPPISLCRSIAADRSCASCCCHCCCSPGSFKKCKQSRRLTFWQRLKQIHRPF